MYTRLDLVKELTQSVIAILVIAGGGYSFIVYPTHPNGALAAAVGTVIGFYFSKQINNGGPK